MTTASASAAVRTTPFPPLDVAALEAAWRDAPRPAARPVRKVLLVHSAHYGENGRLVQARSLLDRLTIGNVAELALPLLAAVTPSRIVVEKVEDYFDEMPFDTDADVVGISAQVMMIRRALELAREFRRRGKIVVMGGFLPTMHPEHVVEEVDALCMGEGDQVWPAMLEDVEAGTLKRIYRAPPGASIEGLPVPRYDLIRRDRFVSYPVQATRGCPFTCDYCSIIQFYERTYRQRPVSEIVRDIQATGSKVIHFVDDNLMENRRFSRELFRAMKDLGVWWGSQVTINVAKDPELLKEAYDAGCRFLAIGVESLSQRNLAGVSKDFNRVDDFARAFRTIQDAGIGVHALIMFGFPEDTRATFDETVAYLEEHGVAIAEFFIMTPYPRTPEGQRLASSGQVVDFDLDHYRESYVVFRHPNLSSVEIQQGYWRAMRRFYSIPGIFRRVWRGTFRDKISHLFFNFAYMIKIWRGIIPVYFGRGNNRVR